MNLFLSIGKLLMLGYWVLPILALFGFFGGDRNLGGDWNYNILWITAAIFYAHLGELIVIKGKLKMNDRDTIHDGLMVILVGFFHWLPIIKKPK